METARYFNKMFGAEIKESIQSDGQSRVDIDINGLIIFIAQAESSTPAGPVDPYVGLDHFGLRVENLDAAAADLNAKGAEFSMEPKDLPVRECPHITSYNIWILGINVYIRVRVDSNDRFHKIFDRGLTGE